MPAPERRAYIIVDLGYGDAGKGTLVDALARRAHAHTVIRYNGGAQAAHNVITPDGRHHTFAQFGSASFLPGVQTFLSRWMLVEPYAMFNEEEHLHSVGVSDAFARTLLDRQALVITPFQQAANRLRELARGGQRHGSCGMGIGETMADALRWGEAMIRAGDLPDRARVRRKLRALREAKRAELEDILRDLRSVDAAREHVQVFDDAALVEIAAENYEALAGLVRLVDEETLRDILHQPGAVIFEGAQGVLLDEDYGFAPYTTWSRTTSANAHTLLDAAAYTGDVTSLGVLRTIFTRHGAGPFVTEDAALCASLHEQHNAHSPWQQHFRLGCFDLVAARYALEVNGPPDALALTHLDWLAHLPALKLCRAYHYAGPTEDLDGFFRHEGQTITAINVRRPPDWDFQQQLTARLLRCTPLYETPPGLTAADYPAAIAGALGLPLAITSHGPTAAEKIFHMPGLVAAPEALRPISQTSVPRP